MKWFLAGLAAVLLLGPGVLSLRRRTGPEARPWLGKGTAIALAVLWVLAVLAIIRAV